MRRLQETRQNVQRKSEKKARHTAKRRRTLLAVQQKLVRRGEEALPELLREAGADRNRKRQKRMGEAASVAPIHCAECAGKTVSKKPFLHSVRKSGRTASAQIKSRRRVREFGEVFTAEREVRAMCDLIPAEVWEDVRSSFLEPACGTGNFVVEILRRKLKRCSTEEDVCAAYDSIWGIDILPDNVEETKRRMLELCPKGIDQSRLPLHILCGDAKKIMKEWEEA